MLPRHMRQSLQNTMNDAIAAASASSVSSPSIDDESKARLFANHIPLLRADLSTQKLDARLVVAMGERVMSLIDTGFIAGALRKDKVSLEEAFNFVVTNLYQGNVDKFASAMEHQLDTKALQGASRSVEIDLAILDSLRAEDFSHTPDVSSPRIKVIMTDIARKMDVIHSIAMKNNGAEKDADAIYNRLFEKTFVRTSVEFASISVPVTKTGMKRG